MLIGLVESSLLFDHRKESLISDGGRGILRVHVHVAHALVTHVEHEADDLRRLRQEGTSLHNVVMVELGGRRVLVELQ